MLILFGLYEGFWRRWFGGGFDFLWDNRFFQHCVNFLVCSIALYLKSVVWWRILLGCLVFQGLYWARQHGELFDFGHSQPPDTKRYDNFWWWKYLKKILPEDELYTFKCDFICMLIRYTIPAILMSVILLNGWFLFAGLGVTLSYAVCWNLFDRGKTNRPTEIAEFLAGFVSCILLLI